MRLEAKAAALNQKKKQEQLKQQMELDEKLKREEKMLKDFEEADKEEAQKKDNDYFN